MLVSLYVLLMASSIETALLDPALYLVPSPPITNQESAAEEFWSSNARALQAEVIPRVIPSSTSKDIEITTSKPEILEASETFWPGLHSIKREVHIPVTFQLAGTYGRYGTGIIGSTYAGITGITGLLGRGKSALAGSSYGSYYDEPMMKIYGSNYAPAWGGWGNGRWGHYGKG